ncbi:unnamed protein product [Calypogeia fissa]
MKQVAADVLEELSEAITVDNAVGLQPVESSFTTVLTGWYCFSIEFLLEEGHVRTGAIPNPSYGLWAFLHFEFLPLVTEVVVDDNVGV